LVQTFARVINSGILEQRYERLPGREHAGPLLPKTPFPYPNQDALGRGALGTPSIRPSISPGTYRIVRAISVGVRSNIYFFDFVLFIPVRHINQSKQRQATGQPNTTATCLEGPMDQSRRPIEVQSSRYAASLRVMPL
jgi:hypothetical protein